MANGVNKVILIGNLGKDPEVRHAANGTQIATFSLATTERAKDQDRTTWHRLIYFGNLAEICEKYLHKGDMVYVEGRIQYREYEDREGLNRSITEIVGLQMRMLSSTGRKEAAHQEEAPPINEQGDIPF